MSGEKDDLIRLEIEGSPGEKGYLRLDDLVSQLKTVESALEQTARIVTEKNTGIYFRVISVEQRSPMSLVLEPVSEQGDDEEPEEDWGRETSKKFLSVVRRISRTGTAPKDVDSDSLRSIREMTEGLDRGIRRVTVITPKARIPLTKRFREKVDLLIQQRKSLESPKSMEWGSVKGQLVGIKLWGKRRFNIEPDIGPLRVECIFPKADELIEEKASNAVKSWVEAFGLLHYKSGADFPDKIEVRDLDVFRTSDNLPRMRELRGVFPDLTGNKTVEEFLTDMRDGP